MCQSVAWKKTPRALCRVVGRWLCKKPRFVGTLPIQIGTTPCLAQMGPRIFVGFVTGIGVYDEAGQRLTTWQSPKHTPEYTEPLSLAVSADGELMVLDYADQCIKVFYADGTLRRKFGHFNTMGWVCTVPRDDKVLVVDSTRVHAFRQSDGLWLQTWPFDLQSSGLCLAPDGETVLISKWNPDGIDAVRVSDGQLVHRWNNDTSGESAFQSPQGVVPWQDCLFVANARRVTVLRQCDGKPLFVLDSPVFDRFFPSDLLITRAGHLWVVAPHYHGVLVFDLRVA